MSATLPGLEAGPRGNWILTSTGKKFHITDPRPEDIDIEDIATALSRINRFGGHTREFYSVAQHSVLVSRNIGGARGHKLLALLHDATEAYLGDMVRPLKELMPAYKEIEDNLERVIFERFVLTAERRAYWPEVKRLDNILLVTEARDVRHWSSLWTATDGIEPLEKPIVPWGPRKAKAEFLKEYHKLTAV